MVVLVFCSGLLNVNGTCGRDCAGTEADSVGVYEFDARSKQVVTTHVMAEGMGGDPYPSLDGSKYSSAFSYVKINRLPLNRLQTFQSTL